MDVSEIKGFWESSIRGSELDRKIGRFEIEIRSSVVMIRFR